MRNIVRCGLLLCSITMFVACGSHSPGSGDTANADLDAAGSQDRRTLNRALPGEPRTLDPQVADDTFSIQVIGDLYEGLTAEDRAGRIVPGAASSWTLDETGTVYTFQLRPDAKWSDGQRTSAAEFVQGLRRAVDPETASGSADLLAIIKNASEIAAGHKKASELGATAIGDESIRIELTHPAPYLLGILAQPIASPFHLAANDSPRVNSAVSGKLISNGPYILINRIPGSVIELARNPFYWDIANVAIRHVRYLNAESESTELREYAAGQLDMTFTIPMPDLMRISRLNGSEVQSAPILATQYLAFNLSHAFIRDSKDLRQALSIAVDRDLIAEHVMMGVTPAYAFVAKGMSDYVAPEYEWSKWPRERQLTFARALFTRAGYSDKNPLRLKLYFNRDEGIQRIMVAIAGSWREHLGVETELVSDEFRVFLAGRKDRARWDVARLAWNADYDDPTSFLDVFDSGNSQNDPGYSSSLFQESMEQAKVEPDPAKRSELLRQSEQVLLNDYPIIPVYFYKARRLVKPYLGGAQIAPMNHAHSKHLYWKTAS